MHELQGRKWLPETFDRLGIEYPRTEKGNPSFTAGKLGWMAGHTHWLPSLIANEDEEVRQALQKSLTKRGVEIHLNARVEGIGDADGAKRVTATTPEGQKTFDAEYVLVATGRKSNTAGLDALVNSGLALDRGKVIANERMETNLPGVYAFTQAPPGFDPDTAAPGELARYGYPSRPDAADGPEALAAWRMATAPHLKRVVPALLRTNRYHLPMTVVSADAVSGTVGSLNWSGYALTGGRGLAGFHSVLGHWTIPTAQQRFRTCSGIPVYSAQLVGIDGFNDDYVLQSGSEADAYCDNGRQRGEYYPWIEWVPGLEYLIVTSARERLPFYPGDYLMVQVWATKWVGGASHTAHVLFTDLTRDWQASLRFSAAEVGHGAGAREQFAGFRVQTEGSCRGVKLLAALDTLFQVVGLGFGQFRGLVILDFGDGLIADLVKRALVGR